MRSAKPSKPSITASTGKMSGPVKKAEEGEAVFSEGDVFEKAGVNVSVVYGTLSPEAAERWVEDINSGK